MKQDVLIYKILTANEYQSFRQGGHFAGSEGDQRDGFMHFSSAGQVNTTLSRHFRNVEDAIIIEVDSRKLAGQLRWEPAHDGSLFPHLYEATLPASAATAQWTRTEWKAHRQ